MASKNLLAKTTQSLLKSGQSPATYLDAHTLFMSDQKQRYRRSISPNHAVYAPYEPPFSIFLVLIPTHFV
jgi:hypothetical protein